MPSLVAELQPTTAPADLPTRVARLSYFFPAHNEEANLEGLVAEALATLPTLADTFEIIAVDDGSKDRTRSSPTRSLSHTPTWCGSSTTRPISATERRCGRGSGPPATSTSRSPTATDSSRIVDLGRLTTRMAEPDQPDVVVGFRIKRADPPVRIAYARAYRLANRIFFGLTVTDVDCACKLFRREALEGIRVESGGAFFSAELIVKLRATGRTVVEVGVPHYPRTAGSATGAKPQVVLRAVRDFWLLRLRMWADRSRALRRGEPMLKQPLD